MKTYNIYGESIRYAYKKVKAKNKLEARKLADNDWDWEETDSQPNRVKITDIIEV